MPRPTTRPINPRQSVDSRQPVLVGVGTASATAEAASLMHLALEAAAADSGAPGLLPRLDRIAVPRGMWGYRDPARLVADRVGAGRARSVLAEIGVSQQALIDWAMGAIVDGTAEVVAVVGGEARAWSKSKGSDADGGERQKTAQPAISPDEVLQPDRELYDPAELAVGLLQPVQQYAMIDNALRAAEGLSVAEHRRSVAELWARYNQVAQANPRAAFPRPMGAREIAEPGPENRPLAFPYNKWHASQWTVNQAAALLLCSAGAAERAGVPPDRWVFPVAGIHHSRTIPLVRRPELHRWPAMAALGRAAAAHIGRPLDSIEVVDLYSCFPAAVRVQQRELGLPAGGTPTVTGGMAFAGGPLNNYVYQATAEVVARLRGGSGDLGLVTTVSGLLTKPGLAIWATRPPTTPPLLGELPDPAAGTTPGVAGTTADLAAGTTADLAAGTTADLAAGATVEVADGYRGPATVRTYTVTYDGLEPARLVVLAETPDGRRCTAETDDRRLAAAAVSREHIGALVEVKGHRLVSATPP